LQPRQNSARVETIELTAGQRALLLTIRRLLLALLKEINGLLN
jgi:hypothetical protein